MQAATLNTPARRWIVGVWELAIAALVVNTVVSSWNVNNLAGNQARVGRTRDRELLTQELISALKDAETGSRGYALTGGQVEFREPYDQATPRIEPLYEELAAATSDDPIQRDRLGELKVLIAKKMDFNAASVKLVKDGKTDEARDLARNRAGKELMDRIRALVKEISAHEEARGVAEVSDTRFSYWVALGTSLGGGALTLAMVGVAFVLVRRELVRRTAVENELRASEAGFRVLAEVMPQIVWVTRPDGNHIYYNPRWYEYTGLNQEESVGAGWSNPLHPDDRDRSQARWRLALETGDPYEIEYRFRGAEGGYRWFLGRAQPQRDHAGRITRWIGTCTDIDESKRQSQTLEEQIRSRTAQLVAVNSALVEEIDERKKAEALGSALLAELKRSNEHLEQFAYVASHDLQEPLRKIQAFGDLVLRKYRAGLDEQGNAYIDRMIASATRMRSLIDDLLTFSRISTRPRAPEQVNLGAVVDGVLSDLENQITRTGGRVLVSPLPTLEADPPQMRQLFQNLIGNALKFHKPGSPPEVKVEAEVTPERCRILLKDNGIGFEEEYAERIFQMFQRLHGRGEYEGTGMGLAICRKIVERHGGTISARSIINEGTTFIVELPLRSPLALGGNIP